MPPATNPESATSTSIVARSVIAAAYFESDEPRPRDRSDQQVPQGAGLRLAGDRVAGEQSGRERQEERLDHHQPRERREESVGQDLIEEGRALAAIRTGRRGQFERDHHDDRDRGERRGDQVGAPSTKRLHPLNAEHLRPPRARGTRPRGCRARATGR